MTYSNFKLFVMKCKDCGHIVEIDDILCYNCYVIEEPIEEPTEFWEPRRPSADELEDELPF
jgi:NMD protein affecting ribosome stability and mRNA decay